MSEASDLHKGHRKRMLKRYTKDSINCFEEHEILEMLLYYVYTRRNTNDISHHLINRFGSLSKVLDAPPDMLTTIDNVGASAATFISLIHDIIQIYNKSKHSYKKINNSDEACLYCLQKQNQKHSNNEEINVIALDCEMNIIDECCLAEGSADDVLFNIKDLLRYALKASCNRIIVEHSHPNKSGLPSLADISSTRNICEELSKIGIVLMDHIVINNDGCYSMRESVLVPDLWI